MEIQVSIREEHKYEFYDNNVVLASCYMLSTKMIYIIDPQM